MRFSIKDFFSKCDQISSLLQFDAVLYSVKLKKSFQLASTF